MLPSRLLSHFRPCQYHLSDIDVRLEIRLSDIIFWQTLRVFLRCRERSDNHVLRPLVVPIAKLLWIRWTWSSNSFCRYVLPFRLLILCQTETENLCIGLSSLETLKWEFHHCWRVLSTRLATSRQIRDMLEWLEARCNASHSSNITCLTDSLLNNKLPWTNISNMLLTIWIQLCQENLQVHKKLELSLRHRTISSCCSSSWIYMH